MSTHDLTLSDYRLAAEAIHARTAHQATIGLILGSGLGALADAVAEADRVPYSEIRGWPHSGVEGHANQLVIGKLEGKAVMVMQGRSHFYEGYTMQQSTFPVRVMQMFGIKTLIVTNAAGGLNPEFKAGDLMLINDHINLPGMAGHHPLIGANDEALGPRFPDMSSAYDPKLGAVARQIAAEKGILLREGVYVGLSGPSFETPAEVRMLRAWGADAVGMSTVWETTVARHGGMRVLGLSGITNVLTSPIPQETTHEEVLAMGRNKIVPELIAIVRGVLAGL